MSSQRSLHFYSDGLRLAAVLFLPEGGGPHPGIVLCHGFTGIKELVLPDYASRFAAAGYAALTFDYRGFGESEGPRGRLIAREQVVDIRNAITFLQCQPQVDPQRIGLWGTSYGGAHAPYVAGIDARVMCAVGQVGFGDGGRLFRRGRSDKEMAPLLALLEQDRRQRVLTGKGAVVPPLQLLADEDSVRFFTDAIRRFPQLETMLPLETAEATLEYVPEEVVHRISPRALLLIAAEHDMPCPKEEYESMYARAGEPKKLVVLPGLRHYHVYEGEGLKTTAELAIDWFNQHLGAG